MLKRRHTVTVSEVAVGTRRQERVKHSQTVGATVHQHDGFHNRRPVQVADMVERPAQFRIEAPGIAHGYEFALVAALGLLVATGAIVFMRLLLAVGPALARGFKRPELRPALAGLAVGLTALALPDELTIVSWGGAYEAA